MNNSKNYTCPYCKKRSDTILVEQKETRLYSVMLETNQWEDEGEDVNSQQIFCIRCEKPIIEELDHVL